MKRFEQFTPIVRRAAAPRTRTDAIRRPVNDFATSVPGLSFQSNSPTNNLIAIRGVASSTAELGSAVAVYLDDVPVGASTSSACGTWTGWKC